MGFGSLYGFRVYRDIGFRAWASGLGFRFNVQS